MNESQSLGLGLSLIFGLLLFGAGCALAWAGGTMAVGALFSLLNAWLGR